jgi:serine/threonine protein kinase
MGCLDDNGLLAFVEGRLPGETSERVEAHLDACEACRALVAEVARSLASSAEADGGGARGLDPGTLVAGRYAVRRVIGAGAMGVVYEAHDRELHRRVALKLVRPSGDDASRERLRARVRREARAMARLSHPNVVAVYDVGTHAEAVFVTMELVDGTTLSEALAHRRHGWRQVLDLFRQAGEGLEAAHAAGIVHRDFKPDNVLVGTDGRAKVSDFGIARAERATSLPVAESTDVAGASSLHSTTRAAGTPAYMAPEQMRGEETGVQADVFSFCVALYEALYDRRPFEGATVETLLSNIERGELRPRPGAARVPARIRRALARGLDARTARRTPTMTAVLRELRSARPVSLRWAAAAAVAVTIFTGAAVWSAGRAAPAPAAAHTTAGDEVVPARGSSAGASAPADLIPVPRAASSAEAPQSPSVRALPPSRAPTGAAAERNPPRSAPRPVASSNQPPAATPSPEAGPRPDLFDRPE